MKLGCNIAIFKSFIFIRTLTRLYSWLHVVYVNEKISYFILYWSLYYRYINSLHHTHWVKHQCNMVSKRDNWYSPTRFLFLCQQTGLPIWQGLGSGKSRCSPVTATAAVIMCSVTIPSRCTSRVGWLTGKLSVSCMSAILNFSFIFLPLIVSRSVIYVLLVWRYSIMCGYTSIRCMEMS